MAEQNNGVLGLTNAERLSIYNFLCSVEGCGVDDLLRIHDVREALNIKELSSQEALSDPATTTAPLARADAKWVVEKLKSFKKFTGGHGELVVPIYRKLKEYAEV